ncbi:MAG: hypothetical protein R3C56_37875 [Pirellulaceae bacterium]
MAGFWLEPQEVIDHLRALGLHGHLIVQSAGGIVSISWKYQHMREVIDVIAG